VIEGVMIAALAVGAQSGYIYIRGEYRYLSIIMQKAIKDAYAKGFHRQEHFRQRPRS
jgi:NADH-quinone oxidoreductase subunit F